MKKIAIICLLIVLFPTYFFAQDNTLYDVNYDEPKTIANYDDSLDMFQKIYLQYEDAIKTSSDIIRQEEKETYKKELEEFKAAERVRTDTTIEKMRQAIYGNEVESVRQQETERLTAELTEKIFAELDQELTSKYEEIKNKEIEELYTSLEKKAYEETGAKTQRIKSISSASAQVVIIILLLTLIIFGIKAIVNKKERFDSFVKGYSLRLKDYNGDTNPITNEINTVYKKNEKEKNLRIKALGIAFNNYSSNLKELQDYKNDFEGYRNKFSLYMGDGVWKNDNFNFNKIHDELKKIYKNYKSTGQELFYSLKSRTDADKRDAKNLLNITSGELEDLSKDIDNKNVEEQFLKDKKQLAKDFSILAKSFKKGEF